MIEHRLFWSFVSFDEQHEVTYWRVLRLPFVLSVGQTVRVLDYSPISVLSVQFVLHKNGYLADVNLSGWRVGSTQDEWDAVHARLVAEGWQWFDGFGMGGNDQCEQKGM